MSGARAEAALATGGMRQALASGSERLAAWSDLLDRINVFPVADGDTGRNLVISLHPLKDTRRSRAELAEGLLMSARGNSGNIAAQFFQGFLGESTVGDLGAAVARGRDLAWKAVADPRPGTMLSLFDALADGWPADPGAALSDAGLDGLLDGLEEAVRSTRGQLEALEQAGVVDSGALGMFIFLDAFLNELAGRPEGLRPIAERFSGTLKVGAGYHGHGEHGFCVDAVVRADRAPALVAELQAMGQSVVHLTQGDLVKIHLHTDDPDSIRTKLRDQADVLRFDTDDMGQQAAGFARPDLDQAIHVMTDAAGSVTRDDAIRLGMTVLDSYINVGAQSVPETHLKPEDLYAAMRSGLAVSTSQASIYERHQHYRKALGMHERVLYLCVGSVFTGNHEVVTAWKKEHDPDDRLVVIDTGAASGRLAQIALACAQASLRSDDPERVERIARRAVEASQEWIFLDQLKWLAAGGRLSKPGAFFGDLFRVKPVVSPLPEGAKKVGAVRNRAAQVDFALARLEEAHAATGPGDIMIETTDNLQWVEAEVRPRVTERFAESRIRVRPVSLTSGAHMGPGTWAVAYLPDLGETE